MDSNRLHKWVVIRFQICIFDILNTAKDALTELTEEL